MVTCLRLQNAFAVVTCLDLSGLVAPRQLTEGSVEADSGEGPPVS